MQSDPIMQKNIDNLVEVMQNREFSLDENQLQKDTKLYKLLGYFMAIFSGICFGSNFDFIMYMQNHCKDYPIC